MPYVQRDAAGSVVAAFARPQPGRAMEALAEDAAELADFRAPAPPPDPVDALFEDPAVAGLVAAINDGSLPVGQGLPPETVQEKIRAKMP